MAGRALPRVAISLGDPSGIGPEVTAAALASREVREACIPLVFGDERLWKRACDAAGVRDGLQRAASAAEANGPALIAVTSLGVKEAKWGKPDRAGAEAQLAFLARATDAVLEGSADALCTAPLSKAQVASTGLEFHGHTEYLAERMEARVLMMLAGPWLRVAVHTTHVAIADVPGRISTAGIVEDLKIMDRDLRERFGIRRPRIAVLGLNPHAGEGGLFGDEEAKVIAPAIAKAKRLGVEAFGPLPADGFFPRAKGACDAVLAMFHDQGLIPLKLTHLDDGVNVTLGLPKPRTSPDHGVAYDIAGKGVARPGSMIAALQLAARLAGHRRGLDRKG